MNKQDCLKRQTLNIYTENKKMKKLLAIIILTVFTVSLHGGDTDYNNVLKTLFNLSKVTQLREVPSAICGPLVVVAFKKQEAEDFEFVPSGVRIGRLNEDTVEINDSLQTVKEVHFVVSNIKNSKGQGELGVVIRYGVNLLFLLETEYCVSEGFRYVGRVVNTQTLEDHVMIFR